MAKLTQIIRNSDPVSETDANKVFGLLIPIVERVPNAEAAVEVAGSVISRCALDDDRHLAHVLDWWYVVTTGRPSANGGAHRLPESLDGRVRGSMVALIDLDVGLPAAEWLRKKQEFDQRLSAADLPHSGPEGTALGEELRDTVENLKANRKAAPVEIDMRKLERELRDRGVNTSGSAYKKMRKDYQRDVETVNKAVDLQAEVEPWIRLQTPTIIDEVPIEFKDAVGRLAEELLRPILAANAAPVVDGVDLANRFDSAGRSENRSGRYRLARVVEAWCEESGESVPSLEDEMQRHRILQDEIKRLAAKPSAQEGIDEINIHVLEDDLDNAEKALKRLQEQIARTEHAELARSQLQGLRRKLEESSLSDDADWTERVAGLEARFSDTGPNEIAREINIAFSELSGQLDHLVQEQQTELEQNLVPLEFLGASDSKMREWRQRIGALETREGRGANELGQEIDEALRQLREECRKLVEANVEDIQGALTEEREYFRDEDYESFASQASAIAGWLEDPEPTDLLLRDAREHSEQLLRDIVERRIHRWQPGDGEGQLIQHILDYCKGPLDYDDTDIRRLYVSLKTRPFVILAGLTGSGKSSLTRTFAESLGANNANGRFRRVAVKPDWIDQTEVLGFVNPISNRFVAGWLAETVRDCEREPDRLHFVLLDEMNLAPVEQYLAEWLSAIETSRSGHDDVRLPLYSSSLEPENKDDWPAALKFPDNLLIVGTVNVDETTRPLSERVLDRANVLLLNVEVSDRHHEENGQPPKPWHVGTTEWRKVCTSHASDDHHEFLTDVARILRQAKIGIGLRAHLELERFVANAEGILESEEALDWGIVQRVIPKIRGFKAHLTDSLKELKEEFESVGAGQSASIVSHWLDDGVSDDEFLEGTDPRLAFARI